MNGRLDRWLFWGGALLLANSAYLFAAGDPVLFYFANVLAHLGLGIVLLLPFALWWWRRRRQPLVLLSGILFLASAGIGLYLAKFGNLLAQRSLLWTHIGLAVVGCVGLLVAFVAQRSTRPWRLAVALLLVCLVAPVAALWYQSTHPDPSWTIDNRPAPTTMAQESMGGAEGPFFPSSVRTTHGGPVPSSVYLKPEACSRAGCHPDIYDQWEGSAHHFSSFNNQWYRKSVEYMQAVDSVQSSKWCGGCHDPAILQSGMMDTPIEQILDTPEAQAGLTCTACHMISKVHSTMGQGDYEITIPPLHDLATSDNPYINKLHDFLVRLDPEPHRRTFIKPFFKGEEASKFCSACHKVHLDVPVNNYRWIRGFNEYDNWQASGVSGYGARSFYYPPSPKGCADCHMPPVESQDAGNVKGIVRSHRFPAANTALPFANQDEEQMRAVTEFLKAQQVTVDIFAMTEAREPRSGAGLELRREGPALSTTFAVGEEQGMAVGRRGTAAGPLETIYAPLDRVPATVRRGESTRVDVVVRTRGVGHFFPGGTIDAFEVWLELKAVDDDGRVVFWSGMAGENAPVEPGAAFYRALLIDQHGTPINKRNAWAARAVVYVKLIPPGAADTVHFRLQVPPDAGDQIHLTARLNYRKFSWWNTHFAFAGVPAPGQDDVAVTPHFDDRRFEFTGDTSIVSGKIKEVPDLPITVMAEDHAMLQVVDAGTELPDMTTLEEVPTEDRERWNDYGIGLFLQGDLRAARNAFEQVTRLEPGYVDGWVNLARVALAEGNIEDAQEVLDRALEIDPQLARAHFFQGLVDKERGDYEGALEHLRTAQAQYPQDRVVCNQIGRILFLQHDYQGAVDTLQDVLAIDPEDLMAHYTLMLAYRGLGDIESSQHHQALYERFKADEPSQVIAGDYLRDHPEDNNMRQRIHEHVSVALDELPPEPTLASREAG